MKCYLINLDRAPERLMRMTDLLKQHGVEFERIPAIDARNFNSNELADYRSQRDTSLHDLAPGDIACGSTHLTILRKIACGEDLYAAVMEDDLHLAQDIGLYLKSTDWIPQGADVVKLETFREPTVIDGNGVRLPHGRRISRLRKKHLGAALYVISKHAAANIVADFTPGVECIDVYIFEKKLSQLDVYQVNPAPAIQDNIGGFYVHPSLGSDITNQRVFAKLPKLKRIAKVKREAIRLFSKINAGFYYIWLLIIKKRVGGKVKFKM